MVKIVVQVYARHFHSHLTNILAKRYQAPVENIYTKITLSTIGVWAWARSSPHRQGMRRFKEYHGESMQPYDNNIPPPKENTVYFHHGGMIYIYDRRNECNYSQGGKIQALAPRTTRVWTRKHVVYLNANIIYVQKAATGNIDIRNTHSLASSDVVQTIREARQAKQFCYISPHSLYTHAQ